MAPNRSASQVSRALYPPQVPPGWRDTCGTIDVRTHARSPNEGSFGRRVEGPEVDLLEGWGDGGGGAPVEVRGETVGGSIALFGRPPI